MSLDRAGRVREFSGDERRVSFSLPRRKKKSVESETSEIKTDEKELSDEADDESESLAAAGPSESQLFPAATKHKKKWRIKLPWKNSKKRRILSQPSVESRVHEEKVKPKDGSESESGRESEDEVEPSETKQGLKIRPLSWYGEARTSEPLEEDHKSTSCTDSGNAEVDQASSPSTEGEEFKGTKFLSQSFQHSSFLNSSSDEDMSLSTRKKKMVKIKKGKIRDSGKFSRWDKISQSQPELINTDEEKLKNEGKSQLGRQYSECEFVENLNFIEVDEPESTNKPTVQEPPIKKSNSLPSIFFKKKKKKPDEKLFRKSAVQSQTFEDDKICSENKSSVPPDKDVAANAFNATPNEELLSSSPPTSPSAHSFTRGSEKPPKPKRSKKTGNKPEQYSSPESIIKETTSDRKYSRRNYSLESYFQKTKDKHRMKNSPEPFGKENEPETKGKNKSKYKFSQAYEDAVRVDAFPESSQTYARMRPKDAKAACAQLQTFEERAQISSSPEMTKGNDLPEKKTKKNSSRREHSETVEEKTRTNASPDSVSKDSSKNKPDKKYRKNHTQIEGKNSQINKFLESVQKDVFSRPKPERNNVQHLPTKFFEEQKTETRTKLENLEQCRIDVFEKDDVLLSQETQETLKPFEETTIIQQDFTSNNNLKAYNQVYKESSRFDMFTRSTTLESHYKKSRENHLFKTFPKASELRARRRSYEEMIRLMEQELFDDERWSDDDSSDTDGDEVDLSFNKLLSKEDALSSRAKPSFKLHRKRESDLSLSEVELVFDPKLPLKKNDSLLSQISDGKSSPGIKRPSGAPPPPPPPNTLTTLSKGGNEFENIINAYNFQTMSIMEAEEKKMQDITAAIKTHSLGSSSSSLEEITEPVCANTTLKSTPSVDSSFKKAPDQVFSEVKQIQEVENSLNGRYGGDSPPSWPPSPVPEVIDIQVKSKTQDLEKDTLTTLLEEDSLDSTDNITVTKVSSASAMAKRLYTRKDENKSFAGSYNDNYLTRLPIKSIRTTAVTYPPPTPPPPPTDYDPFSPTTLPSTIQYNVHNMLPNYGFPSNTQPYSSSASSKQSVSAASISHSMSREEFGSQLGSSNDTFNFKRISPPEDSHNISSNSENVSMKAQAIGGVVIDKPLSKDSSGNGSPKPSSPCSSSTYVLSEGFGREFGDADRSLDLRQTSQAASRDHITSHVGIPESYSFHQDKYFRREEEYQSQHTNPRQFPFNTMSVSGTEKYSCTEPKRTYSSHAIPLKTEILQAPKKHIVTFHLPPKTNRNPNHASKDSSNFAITYQPLPQGHHIYEGQDEAQKENRFCYHTFPQKSSGICCNESYLDLPKSTSLVQQVLSMKQEALNLSYKGESPSRYDLSSAYHKETLDVFEPSQLQSKQKEQQPVRTSVGYIKASAPTPYSKKQLPLKSILRNPSKPQETRENLMQTDKYYGDYRNAKSLDCKRNSATDLQASRPPTLVFNPNIERVKMCDETSSSEDDSPPSPPKYPPPPPKAVSARQQEFLGDMLDQENRRALMRFTQPSYLHAESSSEYVPTIIEVRASTEEQNSVYQNVIHASQV